MKKIIGIALLFNTTLSFASNPFLLKKDQNIIQELVRIPKDSIDQLEAYFNDKNETKSTHNLGFGWKVWSPSKPGGYISIRSEFYYLNDSLVGFKIMPALPSKQNLRKKYILWYNNYFKISENKSIYPYRYNFNTLCSPLVQYKGKLKKETARPQISNLMYPTAYLTYYWSGGYSNEMSYDRSAFFDLTSSITLDELWYLAHSINPITRFMAIEELIRANHLYLNTNFEENQWTEKCFEELPKIKTLSGCIGGLANTRELVYEFSQMQSLREKF